MTKGMMRGIIKDIHSDVPTVEEKLTAIQDLIREDNPNCVTKADLVEVLRWIIEEYL